MLRDRVIEFRRVRAGDLVPHPDNWREHPAEQREAYAAILDEIGFAGAILTRLMDDGRLQIIDGHMRTNYSPDEELPVVVTDLSAEEADKALVTFDPLASMARANADKLAALHGRIAFEHGELRERMQAYAQEHGAQFEEEEPTPDPGAQVDRAAELQEKWQTERGQLWQVGRHRVMCGDSTDPDDVARLMGGVKAQGVFTSPPYAMQRKNSYGGIPADEYVDWWQSVEITIKNILDNNGSFFVNIKPHSEDGQRSLYVFDLVLSMVRKNNWLFVDEFCWRNTKNGVPGKWPNRFKNAFEPVYHFAIDNQVNFYPEHVAYISDMTFEYHPLNKNADTGSGFTGSYKHKGYHEGMAAPSNVIELAAESAGLHSAPFPVGLPSFFIKAFSCEGNTWYDPFLGSGTTLVACEQTGRVGYGMEIDPAYVAVVLERLTAMGLEAELEK